MKINERRRGAWEATVLLYRRKSVGIDCFSWIVGHLVCGRGAESSQ